MSRLVAGFARWRIITHKIPGNPLAAHELECLGCAERSGPGADFNSCRSWAFEHTGRNSGHDTYREIVHRYWQTQLME
ncbi:hypothetical protein ACIHFE_03745 [Streptomyces sp. NPDC052396]|uniref:DUF7848 domain-containing protein n=1 Tax=Streptomyces sp. NPDC052396 TaxID=3365689 RepID=UPI0037CF0455